LGQWWDILDVYGNIVVVKSFYKLFFSLLEYRKNMAIKIKALFGIKKERRITIHESSLKIGK
jgi:hypothetical protein